MALSDGKLNWVGRMAGLLISARGGGRVESAHDMAFYSVSPVFSSHHPRPRPRPRRPLLPALAPKQRARPLSRHRTRLIRCRPPSCPRRRRVCSRRSAALRVVATALARARAGLCPLRSRFLSCAL